MRRWVRWLAVVAVMLSLPLKGVAGLAFGCAHHDTAPMTVADGAHAGHGHDHGHVHAAQAAHGHGAEAGDSQSGGQPSCSHCAPCCAAALPADEAPRLAVAGVPPRAPAAMPRAHVDVTLDVPDRPPRHDLA